jgi:hypothetical protein
MRTGDRKLKSGKSGIFLSEFRTAARIVLSMTTSALHHKNGRRRSFFPDPFYHFRPKSGMRKSRADQLYAVGMSHYLKDAGNPEFAV